MATARVHITAALQKIMVTPAGVLPDVTDDEVDGLRELNNMLNSWTTQRRRVNQLVIVKITEISNLASQAAAQSLTGSVAQAALESIVAAAVAGTSVTAPTALATYATITTDNTYADIGMDEAIQNNLALRLGPIYKRPIPDQLREDAATSLLYVLPALPKAA